KSAWRRVSLRRIGRSSRTSSWTTHKRPAGRGQPQESVGRDRGRVLLDAVPVGGRKMEAGRSRRAAAPGQLTIFVADDELPYRGRVREALETHGFSVVAEVDDSASAIAVAPRLRPDICLIELEL